VSAGPHAVSPDQLYDFEQLAVDDRLLDQVFSQMHEHKTVSQLLQNVLSDMLNCDELTRPTPKQLLAVLAPHRDKLIGGTVDYEVVAAADPVQRLPAVQEQALHRAVRVAVRRSF
jgi:hypothetical protein